jgi:predicted transcriptional regulator
MAVLWRAGPGTVAKVRERLPAALAYNTVLTILRNLEAKGFVDHTVEGRTFRYHPAVAEQVVQGGAVSRLVDKLFRGSALRMMAHLVEGEALSAEELRGLHRLLDQRLTAGTELSPDAATGGAPKARKRRHT